MQSNRMSTFICPRRPSKRSRSHSPIWYRKSTHPAEETCVDSHRFSHVRENSPEMTQVPEFRWHPYVTDRQPFEIGDTGITVKPFAGMWRIIRNTCPWNRGSHPSDFGFCAVPHGLCGAKPVRRVASIPDHIAAVAPFSTASPYASGCPGTPTATGTTTPTEKKEDFMCLGFTIQDAVTYISDCSKIPDDILADLQSSPAPVLVLDCLRLEPHLSHLSMEQAVGYARQLKARRTYLLGFSHEVSHEEYETMLSAVGGRDVPQKELTEAVKAGLDTLDLAGAKVWVRPALDGLQVFVSEKGQARDNEYCDSSDDS